MNSQPPRLGIHSSLVLLWFLFSPQLFALPTRQTPDDIPPLAPPLPEMPPTLWEQFGWTLWILIPLVLALVVLVIALWLRPRKPPVLLAPAAQIRAALAALQARPEDGATLSQLSQTLRRYLVATFWLRPEETTTTEFCAALAANAQVGPELSGAINELLRLCDERKFAPGESAPPLDAARRALKLVELAEARHQLLQSAPAPSRA